jgi:hypothetical protein
MIPKKNYNNFIKDDIIGATCLFNEMSIKDRTNALLYLLDNCDDITENNFKNVMLASENLLKCIKIANKAIQGDDDKLIEMAVELYLKEFPEETKTQAPYNVVDEFYLLIKKK